MVDSCRDILMLSPILDKCHALELCTTIKLHLGEEQTSGKQEASILKHSIENV